MDRLSEIRARCEAATPGPWEVYKSGNTVKSHMVHAVNGGCITGGISPKTQNAAFIAHARDDISFLLAEIEKLNDELYDADGTNLVKYWYQQCQIQENGLYNYGKVCAVYKARAEKAEAENRWIPVGERLPEDSDFVYVYCPIGRGSVEATMGMMVRAHKYSGYTHWMPRAVPEPPKGE